MVALSFGSVVFLAFFPICLVIIFQNRTCCTGQSFICLETGAYRLSLLSFGFLLLGAGLHLGFVFGMLVSELCSLPISPSMPVCSVWGGSRSCVCAESSCLTRRLRTPLLLSVPLPAAFHFGCSLKLFVRCLFLWPRHVAGGILAPQPGIEPSPSAVAVQGANHWAPLEALGREREWGGAVFLS